MSASEHYLPAWLVSKVDQHIALLDQALGRAISAAGGLDVVMTRLNEPTEELSPEALEVWNHTCDNCGKHVPETGRSGTLTRGWRGSQLLITMLACKDCWELP